MSEVKGLRYNTGKLPYHLISPLATRELARVLGKGAEKYAERNWENGLVWTECEGSLERHLEKWKLGEEYDPESGCLHMAHVLCNAMFLLHFQLTGTGKDDRPIYKEVIDAHRSTEPTSPVPESAIYEDGRRYDPGSLIQRFSAEGILLPRNRSANFDWHADAVESGGLFDDEADVRPETEPR